MNIDSSSLPFISVICFIEQQNESLPYLISLYCCQDYPLSRRELIIFDTSAENQLEEICSLTEGKPDALNIRYIHTSRQLPSPEKVNEIERLAKGEHKVILAANEYYPNNYLRLVVMEKKPAPSPQYNIGFYMETAFHYQVYRPILRHLLEAGYACHLLISDNVPPGLLKEMQALLAKINDPRLYANTLSAVRSTKAEYHCLVSPYYTPALKGLAPIHIRAMYGLAKEQWNHAWWNVFYHRILCYSRYSQQALNINGNAVMVGNPRFDAWHNPPEDDAGLEDLKLDPKKPTLLYAPTFGELSSIPHWAKRLERLSRDYNIITKLHHGTLYRPEEAPSLSIARKFLKNRVIDHGLTFSIMRKADFVLTDNSGFIFDAIHAGKRTILLNWENMDALLEGQKTFSSPWSADQKIRSLLPVANNIEELRYWLSTEEKWRLLEPQLKDIRDNYCDAWQDGNAGLRAANSIIETLQEKIAPQQNALLYSLRQLIFPQESK